MGSTGKINARERPGEGRGGSKERYTVEGSLSIGGWNAFREARRASRDEATAVWSSGSGDGINKIKNEKF